MWGFGLLNFIIKDALCCKYATKGDFQILMGLPQHCPAFQRLGDYMPGFSHSSPYFKYQVVESMWGAVWLLDLYVALILLSGTPSLRQGKQKRQWAGQSCLVRQTPSDGH